jgi:hypothetical protein
MDTQNLLRIIHRNQQQIDLLTANNTQLIEALMAQGAQDAIAALTARGVRHNVVPGPLPNWQRIAERTLDELVALPDSLDEAPTPKRRGRGRPKLPPTLEEEATRYDSIGRRIPQSRWPGAKKRARGSGEWTPERRAAQAERMRQRAGQKARAARKQAAAQTANRNEKKKGAAKNPPGGAWMHRKSPEDVAQWKARLSQANRDARARKAAMGVDYTTNKPIARVGD